jgi:hypothetical protein
MKSLNTNAAQSNSRRFWRASSDFGGPEMRIDRESYEAAHLEAERIESVADARRFTDELPQEESAAKAFWWGFLIGAVPAFISGVAFACWLVKA